MFATLFFGVIDTKNNTISYVNAGHDLPMIIGNEGVKERLLTCGPAVGMLPNIKYKMNQAQIEPGDIILAYTDGIPEARDPEGNLYSQPKLIELITRLTAEGVSTLNGFVDNILLEVKNHVATAEPSDDVTMIAARYLG
jgi:sigma-B regulation protein RsbU (phosphoserine phosphatase)